MKYSIFILLLLISFFGFYNKTNAQIANLNDDVSVEMIPETPKAGETVYVFLKSYLFNIDLAKITWKVNGKVIKTGTGEKNFNFVMGKDGQTTTLGITVSSSEIGTINKTFSLRPTSVDLIWQSNGFVPPFYKGKSLFSHQDRVTIIAVPHIPGSNGAEISSNNLVYKWKKNGSVVDYASGFGKNTFTFDGSIISRPVSIDLEVTSSGGNSGYASLTLNPVEPSIILYKKDPIYGIEFQKALEGSVELKNSDEISVTAMPLFFSTDDYSSFKLFNTWLLNNIPIGNESSQRTQTFRRAPGVSGSSKISISIENPGKILQFSSAGFNLVFEDKNNN